MMLNAWASGKKPWSFPEVSDMVRENIELRLKLLPYLYTAFYEYYSKGIPPFRAMVLEEGFAEQGRTIGGNLDGVENPYAEKKTVNVTDQYMMGPSILVAPVFAGQTERTVILPAGNWYDFYTGNYAGNNQEITIKTELDKIQLLVKDGAIIPMLADITSQEANQNLQVRHYGTANANYLLYNDDGNTYNYKEDDYTIEALTVVRDKRGNLKGARKLVNDDKYRYGNIDWIWMTH